MDVSQIIRIGVVGAGTMGTGIAQLFVQSGFDVTWYNRSVSGIDRGLNQIQLNQATLIQAGVLSSESARESLARLHPTLELSDLSSVDLLSESIPEDLEVKQDCYRYLSQICSSSAILTTDTSGLSISRMAGSVSQPERFAGLHFLNPAHIIPLVEVIQGKATSSETIQLLMEFSRKIGKKPILVEKEVPGFVAARIQAAVLREALYLVEEGVVSTDAVDTAVKEGLGLRWALLGPLEIADLGGLDIFNTVSSYLNRSLCNTQESSRLLQKRVDSGQLGVKNGAGLHDYEPGRAHEIVSDRDEKLLKLLRIKDT